MPEPLKLRTVLEPMGPAAAIVLSDEQVAQVGGGPKSPPVAVTVNGRTLRLRVARRGGRALIGFSRASRAEAGVEIGDEVDVTIALDETPREVELPDELAAALAADPAVERAFAALAFTHRREYAQWVAEAKRPETRARRAEQAVAMVREGRTRS
jgi:Bacteriocin-protection, YdeI or OmpD-Associated/Domain of unknown function (DUF1905)